MQARVKWVEGLTFLGESASGHQILMDGNSGDKAPSPMEMVLMAAGGCSAIDVVSILQKGRQDVVDCEVKLTSERREEAPRLFTHINLHFIVTGRDLKDAAVARAVDLSAEKYCSVALMLEKVIGISGHLLAPEVCIVVGASGAAALMAGVRNSKFVVAINHDASAAVFSQADVGVVDDWKVVLEALVTNIHADCQ